MVVSVEALATVNVPCDIDRVTALHCGDTQIGTTFSCTRNVFKLCKIFSKSNCVSFILKNGKSQLFGMARTLLIADMV